MLETDFQITLYYLSNTASHKQVCSLPYNTLSTYFQFQNPTHTSLQTHQHKLTATSTDFKMMIQIHETFRPAGRGGCRSDAAPETSPKAR
jgi:hypothetical protein